MSQSFSDGHINPLDGPIVRKINSKNLCSEHRLQFEKVLSHLQETDKKKMLTFLESYSDIFDEENKPLQATNLVKHKIDTGDHPPIARAPFRIPYPLQGEMKSQIDKMLAEKVIKPSVYPWSTPVVLIKKKSQYGTKQFRFCVDYRSLNEISKRDFFPISNIQDSIDALGGAEVFSTLDMTKGYWQVEVDPKDREKTAFSVPWSHYECNRMSFGLTNSPST